MSRYSPRARLTNTTSTAAVANWFGNQFVLIQGNYESIATQTVGSGGTASVTFSSIPQTYTHLEIRGLSRLTAAAAYPVLTFNSDSSSANYTLHQTYGNGSTVSQYATGTGTLGGAYIWYGATSGEGANVLGPGMLSILDYTNTSKYKTAVGSSGFNNNGTTTGYLFRSSALWLNTSAITSITITAQTGNLAQYSKFALYGIKSA